MNNEDELASIVKEINEFIQPLGVSATIMGQNKIKFLYVWNGPRVLLKTIEEPKLRYGVICDIIRCATTYKLSG